MQIKYVSGASSSRPGLFRKAVTLVAAVALAIVALMFSALLLAVMLIVAVSVGAYLWWKTRAIRKLMREQGQNFPPRGAQAENAAFGGEVFEGEVIEGVAVRVHESGIDAKR